MDKKYKVYRIDTVGNYHGFGIVAAESVEEANNLIDEFKNQDIGNSMNSEGYSYVDREDLIYDLYSERKGIICQEIYYDWVKII